MTAVSSKDMIFAVAEGDVPKLKDSLMRFAVTRGDSAELDHSAFLSDLGLYCCRLCRASTLKTWISASF